MNAPNKLVLLLCLALSPVAVCAQEPENQMPVDLPTPTPATLNGQKPMLTFRAEETESNFLSGGINLTGAFTDNKFLSTTDPKSEFSYLIQPYISFSQTTSRIVWNANAGVGIIINQGLSNEDQVAGNVGVDLTYRYTLHTNLRFSDTFTDTRGIFPQLNASASTGVGVVEQPNNSLFVPLTQRTRSNTSLAEFSTQFNPTDTAGVRGTFSILDYPGSSQNTQFGTLYNTQSYSGEMFYNHQKSFGQWVGASLRVQRFDTEPSIATTDAVSLLFYYAIAPRPGVEVSLFAGPEYYDNAVHSPIAIANGEFQGHQWTPAAGATVTWHGDNTSAEAGFSRQVSDGGGLYSAVTLQQFNASVKCQLTERQAIYFVFTQSTNQPIGTGHGYDGLSAQVQLEHLVRKNLILRLAYARQRQDTLSSMGAVSANLAWVSLSYNLSRPIGK
jgi:hypothetical protein